MDNATTMDPGCRPPLSRVPSPAERRASYRAARIAAGDLPIEPSEADEHPAKFARQLLDTAARYEAALPALQHDVERARETVTECEQVIAAAKQWAEELLARCRKRATQ